MHKKTRIEKDIIMFEENIEKLKNQKPEKLNCKIVEIASQYYKDSKYYFTKKDYFTAFGCINYGHGLLDSILNF